MRHNSAPRWYVLVLAGLCLSVSSLAQTPPRRENFSDLVRQAAEAYRDGQADRSIDLLQRAYALQQVPLLLFNIGRSHELAGRYATAIDYYDRYLATNPSGEQAATARNVRENARRLREEQERQANNPPPRNPPDTPPNTPPNTPPVVTQPPPPIMRDENLPVVVRGPRRVRGAHIGFWSVGGAGFIAGAVLGGMTLGTLEQFSSTASPLYRPQVQDLGNALAWGTNIALLVGVSAVTTGVILYFTQDTRMVVRQARARSCCVVEW